MPLVLILLADVLDYFALTQDPFHKFSFSTKVYTYAATALNYSDVKRKAQDIKEFQKCSSSTQRYKAVIALGPHSLQPEPAAEREREIERSTM